MAKSVGELVAYIEADNKGFRKTVDQTEKDFSRLESTATKSTARMEATVSKGFQKMARSASDALDDVADSAERLLKYGELDVDVDAEADAALATLKAVDQALSKIDGRTATARVDVDNRGALSSLTAVADGAAKSGSAIGTAMNSALDVIGTAGPVKVAALAGAIQLLPSVASVAASGIVFAVGGALAAVGVASAAQSEKVKRAWTELGAELKAELADAAEPLEDSLLRAADVAETTFQRIKPALARIFRDLVPDIDVFVNGVGAGIQRIMPHLEKVGDSFGRLISNLGRQLPSIMDTLGDTFTTFAEIMDEDPQMLANLVQDAADLLRAGAEVLAWADDIKGAFSFLSQANPKPLVDKLMGGSPEEQARQLEELSGSLTTMELEVRKGISAIYEAGKAGGEAASGIRDFNAALEEHVDPAQKALEAEIKLKEALQEAKEAAKDKKMTEIERLSAVQDITKAIRDSAAAEHERTGKTQESAQAFLDSLPKLLDYAGKNETAREAVTSLGDSLGITAKRTRDGVIAIDELGRVIKILPNGKKVEIDANTAKGKAEIEAFKLWVARQKGTIDVHVRTIYDNPSGRKAIENKVRASGGIYSADGNTRYMAAGGFASGSSMSPPPMIADSATFLPHNNTIFGEAGKEAFIPLSGKHKSRALDILGKVAKELGVEVYDKNAAKRMKDAADVINNGAGIVAVGIQSAMGTISDTLGASGTLTSALLGVGEAGGSMTEAWTTGSEEMIRSVDAVGDEIGDITLGVTGTVSQVVDDMTSRMGVSIDGLSGSVADLARAVAEARAAASGSKSSAQSARGKATSEKSSHASARGKATSTKSSQTSARGKAVTDSQTGGLVEGHYGTTAGAPLVDMSGSTWQIREDADIYKISSAVTFAAASRPF